MSDDLMDRFDDVEDSEETTDQTEDTGHTDTTDDGGGTSADGSTRSRSQYPMYLSDDLQEELNDTFDRFNAQRTLDGDGSVEKHKDFLEAVVREGLDGDWQSRID